MRWFAIYISKAAYVTPPNKYLQILTSVGLFERQSCVWLEKCFNEKGKKLIHGHHNNTRNSQLAYIMQSRGLRKNCSTNLKSSHKTKILGSRGIFSRFDGRSWLSVRGNFGMNGQDGAVLMSFKVLKYIISTDK